MPDGSAGSAAFLSGEEIVNDARTMAYLEAGYGPIGLQVYGGCTCPRIRELIGCPGAPYVSPTADPAPWFDASVPESADFAGFLTTEFEGLGSTYTRENVDKITGGAVLGRLRPTARTLTWRGFLFGRSECAVQYGLRWLTANLRGSGCICGGEDLELMICCPELTDITACSGIIQAPESCPPFTVPDAFRTLKNVGLVAGPTILSQRKIGCDASCGSPVCLGDSLIIEVEFSLVAGTPYLYGCEVCLCVDQGFESVSDCVGVWVKVVDSNNPGISCAASGCPPPFDCTFDENCPPATLPVIPEFEDRCFCEPLVPVQFCCEVPAESFGQFFEGAPVIELYSGSTPMRATTIRFFQNFTDQDCCDVAANACLECDSVQIRFIPANSTMTIDGTTRTVKLRCPGSMEDIIADHLTTTPFAWPILQCVDYCICIETDGLTVAPDASVTVSVVPREM